MKRTANPLDAALEYAARGWPVLPLHTPQAGDGCSCRKRCSSPGKHPRTRQGVKDATRDAAIIRQWWAKWPAANVGIATGGVSGIVALDVDGPEGETALRELCGNQPTPNSLTGRGRHAIFLAPNCRVRNRAAIGPSLDVRGDGGYIVAPPSLHATGIRYTWDEARGLGLALPPALLPTPVLELLSRRPGSQDTRWPGRIPEGQRNDFLTAEAGRIASGATDADQVARELATVNRARCDPPYPDSQARGIAERIWTLEVEQRAAQGRNGPRPGAPSGRSIVDWRDLPVGEPWLLRDLGYLLDLARLIACKAEMLIATGHGNRAAWVGDGEAEIPARYLENRWRWPREKLRDAWRRWERCGLVTMKPPRRRTDPARVSVGAWSKFLPSWNQADAARRNQARGAPIVASQMDKGVHAVQGEHQARTPPRNHKITVSMEGSTAQPPAPTPDSTPDRARFGDVAAPRRSSRAVLRRLIKTHPNLHVRLAAQRRLDVYDSRAGRPSAA